MNIVLTKKSSKFILNYVWCDILDCAIVWFFFVQLEKFSLIWRRHHYRWRAAYARHSLPLSSGIFFSACHTYYDTEHPFIMVIFEDQWHSQLLSSVISGAVTTCFYDFGLLRLGFDYPNFRMRGERSNRLRHRRGDCFEILKYRKYYK